jgi:hypothetical protein
VVTGAIAGIVVPVIGWPNFFVVTCLTAVPGLILLVILRGRSTNSRRASREAQRSRLSYRLRGSAAQRAIVADSTRPAGVVLEFAIQVFGFDIHRARPVFRCIGRIDELVEQLLVPGIEFHFGHGAVEVLNFDGLILVVDRDHFKELVGTASIPLPTIGLIAFIAASVCYAQLHSTPNESFAQYVIFARSNIPVIEQLVKFFVVFFVVVDPISLIPLFAGLTQGASARYKKKMAGKAAAIALGICVLFALVGAKFLDIMGISLSSFRIAGGTLLFLIALDMVFARTSGTRSTTPSRRRPKARGHLGVSAGVSLHRRTRCARDHFADRRRVGAKPLLFAGFLCVVALV